MNSKFHRSFIVANLRGAPGFLVRVNLQLDLVGDGPRYLALQGGLKQRLDPFSLVWRHVHGALSAPLLRKADAAKDFLEARIGAVGIPAQVGLQV